MAEREMRTKLALKDLGKPDMVKVMTEEQLKATGGKYNMGLLLGKADGVVSRTDDKSGQTYEGLSGTFIMQPSDPNLPELESGILWIPDAFHNLVSAKLREAQKDDPNAECEFAFDVASIKANNPAGYSWSFTPAIPFAGKHPLDAMMAGILKVKADAAKQIENKSKNK